jgi:hypothetical protein
MDAVVLGEETYGDEIVHCAAGDPDATGMRTYMRISLSLRDARHFVLRFLARERRPKLGDRDLVFLRGIAESVRQQLSAAA